MFYCKENVHQILLEAFDINISTVWLAFMFYILFSLLCFIRKIEIFAWTHVFADSMIVITILVIVVYGAMNLSREGNQIDTIQKINPNQWYDAIGFSVYCYEGIGVILPV